MRKTTSSLSGSRRRTSELNGGRRRPTHLNGKSKTSQLEFSHGFLTQKELDQDFIAFNSENRRYNFPHRTLTPHRAVFLQADPIRFLHTSRILTDFTSDIIGVLYSYGASNPSRFVDPIGLQIIDTGGVGDLDASVPLPAGATSWFQPTGRIGVGMISREDIAALEAEINRLKDSNCFVLVVRILANYKILGQALQKCDLIFIAAHGGKTPPYIELPGDPDKFSWPANATASQCWIGACQGQGIATNLNAAQNPGSSTSYTTLPGNAFDPAGDILRSQVIQGITAALKKLHDVTCCPIKTVCLLSGPQQHVARPPRK